MVLKEVWGFLPSSENRSLALAAHNFLLEHFLSPVVLRNSLHMFWYIAGLAGMTLLCSYLLYSYGTVSRPFLIIRS